ncbi:MAG: DUF4250 domain-containing protein [Lachnospiraceae bacterium]|nr:DUF4250 domain-containing protein [Candidatus Merdinaster equi]
MLPSDPIMLLSVVNTKLRDFYPSLKVMCEEMDESETVIKQTLESAGYHYSEEKNQFV